MKNKSGETPPEFKKRELREIILKTIGLTLVVGGCLVFPNLPIALGAIIGLIKEDKGYTVPEKKIKRVIKHLIKRNILFIESKGNEVYVHIKDNNSLSILRYSIKSLLDFKKKQKKWDSKWFLVFFDVPETERSKRDYLRKFLKQLGFYQYQKSVYMFPYDCENEIALIKQIVEGGKYMRYIVAEKIEDESQLKTFFHL